MKRKITLGLVSAMEMLTKVMRLISSEVQVRYYGRTGGLIVNQRF